MFVSLRLTSVVEEVIRAYFESRLALLEPVFPLACHRLCEGPDFSLEFGFKPQPQTEGKQKQFIIFSRFFFFFLRHVVFSQHSSAIHKFLNVAGFSLKYSPKPSLLPSLLHQAWALSSSSSTLTS